MIGRGLSDCVGKRDKKLAEQIKAKFAFNIIMCPRCQKQAEHKVYASNLDSQAHHIVCRCCTIAGGTGYSYQEALDNWDSKVKRYIEYSQTRDKD